MSEDSPGENNIESLAERAKEMLDRVRAHSEEPDADEFLVLDNRTDDAFAEDPIVDDVIVEAVQTDGDETDVAPDQDQEEAEPDHDDPDRDQAEPDDGVDIAVEQDADPIETDASSVTEDVETVDVDAGLLDAELDDAWATELDDEQNDDTRRGYVATLGGTPETVDDAPEDLADGTVADEHDDEPNIEEVDGVEDAVDPEDDRALTPAADVATTGVEHLFAEESDDDARESGRRFGGLIPLILLALFILALLLFVASLLGSDDDDGLAGPTLVEDPDDGVESSTDAAPTSTAVSTTEAPPQTSTTTSIEPDPEPAIPETAWELLGEGTGTAQFAVLGGPLGLQEALEASVDDDGNPIEFTLFAPSDTAIQALTPEQLASIAQDPAAAEALVGYHFVDQRLSPELIFESAGSQLQTRSGLPIDVSLDGDEVVLNGNIRLSQGLVAGNGDVIVIDGVLQPPTLNQVLELGTIQFEVRSSVIAPAGEAELQKAVAFFTDNPEVSALIEGHTDTDGPSGPNQRLSDRRANAVRDFLIAQGIDASRLEAVGLGEAEPIIVNGVEDKVASRRIEFEIR